MPIPLWTCTVSEEPRLAARDYRRLPPCVLEKPDKNWPEVRGTWIGSGFQVKDLRGSSWYHSEKAVACGACGSHETACIYLYAEPAQTWILMRIELECRHCGKYTLWEGED